MNYQIVIPKPVQKQLEQWLKEAYLLHRDFSHELHE